MRDSTWLKARIEAAKAIVEAYETAITALAGGSVQSFTLDTGQTRQTVTKKDMARLEVALDSALNRVATLEARLYGAAGQGRPGY
jgi:hypothetical protein